MHDRATRTSLEVHFAAGHCVPAGSRTIGFPRFDPTTVSVGEIAFPARPSPAPFGAGSFPRASFPLRSLFACLPAPLFSSAQSCLGVPSLFAASLKVSTQCGHYLFPCPLGSVLRFSQPLDGFLHLRLRRLLSSRSHVQGLRSGVWSRFAAVADSSSARASLPFSRPRSPVARLPHARDWTSRLSSAERYVRRIRCLASSAAVPLFGFSSSRSSPSHPARPSPLAGLV